MEKIRKTNEVAKPSNFPYRHILACTLKVTKIEFIGLTGPSLSLEGQNPQVDVLSEWKGSCLMWSGTAGPIKMCKAFSTRPRLAVPTTQPGLR